MAFPTPQVAFLTSYLSLTFLTSHTLNTLLDASFAFQTLQVMINVISMINVAPFTPFVTTDTYAAAM